MLKSIVKKQYYNMNSFISLYSQEIIPIIKIIPSENKLMMQKKIFNKIKNRMKKIIIDSAGRVLLIGNSFCLIEFLFPKTKPINRFGAFTKKRAI